MIATADGILTNNVAVTLNQVNTTLEELRVPIATADSVLKSTRREPSWARTRRCSKTCATPCRRSPRRPVSLRILMDYLEQHPESLLRGKTEVKP